MRLRGQSNPVGVDQFTRPFRAAALRGVLGRLVADRAGNTLALVAAAIFPILAMVGSGVDMGRSYLSQSRLQQACDAGVLAARKRLGTSAAIEGNIPDDVAEIGQRFFNLNFRSGSYGTRARDFAMTLEGNFAISGDASVSVPTTVMRAFGFEEVPVAVSCEAQLSMTNTDIMMVLDVTGSMAQTNPGDTTPKIEAMKDTIRSFYVQLAAASNPAMRIRFGFVPYSSNVNVGGLLEDDWVVDEWHYQSRERKLSAKTETTRTYTRNWTHISGVASETITHQSYPATWNKGNLNMVDSNDPAYPIASAPGGGFYSCEEPLPGNSYNYADVLIAERTFAFIGPPPGIQTIQDRRLTENGTNYWLQIDGSTCLVKRRGYTNYVQDYERVTEPAFLETHKWQYRELDLDVSDWRTASNGCVEERDTYEIGDYGLIDFTRALDLDIDLVPTDNAATKWRPMYPGIIFARAKKWDNTGVFDTKMVTTDEEFVDPYSMGKASCPPPARKLAEMTTDELNAFLATLHPAGQTYHDIGMIWGGRLVSPSGLFAAENADASPSHPTTRHLIFLTDGETAPLDLVYSSYGLEPLDQRRWSPTSPLTLQQTVENRFAVACDEVKKRNVMVWVIAFGTSLNPIFQQCSGAGRYFEAEDAGQLDRAFAAIAKQMGELRINR
jgi:Flp pilus assembly protein TadG